MIRTAVPMKNGNVCLIIGLEARNIEHLRNGKPVKFDAKDVGFQGLEVAIFAGTTAEDMVREFAKELSDAGIEVEARMAESNEDKQP
jgi:hypothetical protein